MKQVTVITGGAGGMGYATANVFGRLGHKLLLCDVKEEALAARADILKKQNMDVEYAVVDVSDAEQVKAAAAKAAELGEVKNIINTAGLSPILVRDLPTEKAIESLLKVNAIGTVNMTEAFYPILAEGGSMVCFTSSAVYLMPQVPEPMLNAFYSVREDPDGLYDKLAAMATDPGRAYMFGKMFVYYYVKMNVGRFGKKQCRINSIAPGRIVTPMHQTLIDMEPERIEKEMADMPMGRYGNAYEIANLIDFLCSYRASYISGVDILMDEGTQAYNTAPQIGQ